MEAGAWLEEVGHWVTEGCLVLTPPLSCSPKSEALHYAQNRGDSEQDQPGLPSVVLLNSCFISENTSSNKDGRKTLTHNRPLSSLQ